MIKPKLGFLHNSENKQTLINKSDNMADEKEFKS